MIEIFYFLDCMVFEYLDVVLRIQVEHSFFDSFGLVLDLGAFHLHKIDSHGFLELMCSGLGGCY